MTRAWHLLPTEVWINVFSFVPYMSFRREYFTSPSKKDLATCRLVCKQWSALAERVMFSLLMSIKENDNFIRKLLYHLSRKPTLARLIKTIKLRPFFKCTTLQCRELLKIIITTEIEQIKGNLTKDEFYELLLQIIESTQGLKKLKHLPGPITQSDVYMKVVYACRDTLMDLEIGNLEGNDDHHLQHLNEFEQLQKIKLILQNMADVGEIDQILQKLGCINHVEGWIKMGRNYIVKSQHEMSRWLAENVEKDENLRCLGYNGVKLGASDCNLLEYFLHKYPKLETLSMSEINGFNDHFRNPLEIVKHLPVVQMKDSRCYTPEDLWMVGYSLKSRTNTIKMLYAGYVDGDCEVELTKRMDTFHTDFKIELASEKPHLYFKQFLSSVCTGDSDIIDLHIDLVHYKDATTEPEEKLTLYDILQWTPHIQQLYFSDERIDYKKQPPGTLILNELKTLTFYGAEIQTSVITQISNAAPNLEELKLSTCFTLDPRDKDFGGYYYIDLPQSTLKIIEILAPASKNIEALNEEDFDRLSMQKLRTMSNQINIARNMYLLVSIDQSSENQYFLLPWNENDNIMIISEEEYDLHSVGDTIVHIECKDLSELKLKTSHFDVQLRWKDGKLEDAASYVVSEFLELRQENSALKKLLASKEQSSSAVKRMEVDDSTL